MSTVYAWGSNQYNQLGGSYSVGIHQYVPLPWDQSSQNLSFNSSESVIQVAAGDGHSLLLTEDGQVHACGRGKEGQLGTQNLRGESLVAALENETIVHIAAGALTSYAVTVSGQVYQWGLVLRTQTTAPTNEEDSVGAQSGQLTGMAENRHTFVVPVDAAAREAQAETHRQGNRPRHEGRQGEVRRHARQIRSSVGRQLNEIVCESTERWLMPTADADREYYEELCAMGYQVEEAEERMQERGREYHGMISMGCTRQAQHVPRRIPNMDHVLVRSVAAGYAHVMLLSDAGQLYAAGYNDRGQLGLGHRINTSEFKQVDFLSNKLVLQVVCGQQHTICRAIDSHSGASNAAAGANAYVWGNGILGQLGIGVRGTSKGRLLPTLVDLLFKQYPCGIVDVGAGGNFTVAVTSDGQVYSFGHAEYNQHGTGNRANNDYIDPHFYFVPRNIMDAIQPRDKQRICIRSVHCGQNYTIGVDEAGDVYSWGWNESGVLGHGLHHYSAEPTRVQSIGGYVGRKVLGVAAGAKHVLVLAQTQCNSWARRFAPPDASLSDEAAASEFVDCYLQCEGGAVSLPCHKAVLAARSHYLRGFILAAEADSDERQPVRVPLGSASAASAKVLLEYIYKDTAPATSNPRQRLQLVSLAAELLVTQLQSGLGLQTGYHSSYVLDMTALLACSQHADMVFTASASLVAPRLPDEKTEVALAHRVVVSRIPYYAALLGGRFADSHRLEAAGDRQQRRYEVDIDGLLRDGISVESFRALLHFAYTGELVIAGSSSDESALSESQLDSVMNILVAANRLGFQLLALQCERKLSTHLGLLSRLSVEGCLQFAQAYNLGRLEKQCVAALSRKA